MSSDNLQLMLCCNNYRNGTFKGVCRSISLGGCNGIHLDSPYFDSALKCRIEESSFRLGETGRWPHYGHTTWVGNWCWDAISVSSATAVEVINFALKRGYRPTSGEMRLFDKAHDGQPVTVDDLLAALGRRATA